MRVDSRGEETLISVGTCSLGVSKSSRQSSPQKTRIEMMMEKSLIRERSWSTFRESRGEENMGDDNSGTGMEVWIRGREEYLLVFHPDL